MATYRVNDRAVARARQLIRSRQYVLDSDWGDVQPKADSENAYLASHSWAEYASGTSDSPRTRPTRPRPATRSSTATSVASTARG
jgi:hypothetical protein